MADELTTQEQILIASERLKREQAGVEVAPAELKSSAEQVELTPAEKQSEKTLGTAVEQAGEMPAAAATAAASVAAPTVEIDPEVTEVEKLLSEGLESLFITLPANRQKEFKEEGEKIAGSINKLLHGVKVKVTKIIELVRGWLAMIPGVNKFFIEQETKIKIDKLMELKKKRDEEKGSLT